jgi:hypothetical protein
LATGKYELTVTPNNDSNAAETINFESIQCFHYWPPNECNECEIDEACEGSQCVATGDLRFTLVYLGGVLDEAKVTTPDNVEIVASVYDALDDSDLLASSSFIPDLYTQEGGFVKSIVFPSKEVPPKEEDTVSLVLEETYFAKCCGGSVADWTDYLLSCSNSTRTKS